MGAGPQQPHGSTAVPGALPPDPDALPATKGNVRDLRRWVIVAGVWAVAASAIAIIALVSGNDGSNDAARTSTDVSAQVARVQRALDKRIEALDSKIQALPTSDDVSKLQSGLNDAQDKAASAATDAKDARSKAADLERRLSALEQAQQGNGGTTTPQAPP
jgi:TolA-binding protein